MRGKHKRAKVTKAVNITTRPEAMNKQAQDPARNKQNRNKLIRIVSDIHNRGETKCWRCGSITHKTAQCPYKELTQKGIS